MYVAYYITMTSNASNKWAFYSWFNDYSNARKKEMNLTPSHRVLWLYRTMARNGLVGGAKKNWHRFKDIDRKIPACTPWKATADLRDSLWSHQLLKACGQKKYLSLKLQLQICSMRQSRQSKTTLGSWDGSGNNSNDSLHAFNSTQRELDSWKWNRVQICHKS